MIYINVINKYVSSPFRAFQKHAVDNMNVCVYLTGISVPASSTRRRSLPPIRSIIGSKQPAQQCMPYSDTFVYRCAQWLCAGIDSFIYSVSKVLRLGPKHVSKDK